jgi:hypothetical protein
MRRYHRSPRPRRVTLGVFDAGSYIYQLRAPSIGDGPMWKAAMDLHEDRISGAFGAGTAARAKWRSQHSLVSWWEHFRLDAVRAARCEASSFVLVQTAADGDDVRIVGEFSICGIDPDSGAGEMSVWALPEWDCRGSSRRSP